MSRLAGAFALALATAALALPASASASVKITATPGLKPGFRTDVSDYVARCQPGKPLHFAVSASGGDTVAIGSNPKRSGDFTVDVTRRTGAAVTIGVSSGGRSSTHHVRCLPLDFPSWTVHRHGTPQSQWYVMTPIGPKTSGYVAVFDNRGTPVWWMHASSFGPWDGKLLPDGNLAWSRQFNDKFGINPNEAWEEHRLDGSAVRTLQTVGVPTDMHDLEVMPNGDYLLDAYRPRTNVDLRAYGGPQHATVYDGEIQELTPAGKLVWSWNSKDHIGLGENTWWSALNKEQAKKPPDKQFWDLVHLNSVEPDGDGFVVSARFLDAVFRIDKKTGNVTWKVGGTKTSKSLKVQNDPLGAHPFRGQHDARLFSDGSLTVFDNGTEPNRRPRVVRYRIDTQARTAKLLEGFGDGDIPRSGWGGSARKLAGGNWVVYWGGTDLMTERTPSGKVVLSILFADDMHSYRSFPIPPGRLSARALRQGMNKVARITPPPQR